ncbi:DUF2695 domain-containing protein [Dyadobacter sp. CY261]|uniref:DUF2695 domain-containing protein n=1 Tax=Dyadobacter sp. CY261 TaxID=2907203 RepID=UPI001F48D4BF|nr:DUF2695 domain-containing protein [Dyadobacter sp. CY261]MCF0068892.1 DUF2695 domain-containing protein [Dyadobacter sp. CY261]
MNKENEIRKQLKNDFRQKARDAFENSLPMTRTEFRELFDYLDEKLNKQECDNQNTLSKKFLEDNGITNTNSVLEWLAEKGGYCDCEILANVEEHFE